MARRKERLEVLGRQEEPLIEDLEKTRYTPEAKAVTREELLPRKPEHLVPEMDHDDLLAANHLIPEAKPRYTIRERRHKPYLERLAESVG